MKDPKLSHKSTSKDVLRKIRKELSKSLDAFLAYQNLTNKKIGVLYGRLLQLSKKFSA